jgi:hypothetical protein
MPTMPGLPLRATPDSGSLPGSVGISRDAVASRGTQSRNVPDNPACLTCENWPWGLASEAGHELQARPVLLPSPPGEPPHRHAPRLRHLSQVPDSTGHLAARNYETPRPPTCLSRLQSQPPALRLESVSKEHPRWRSLLARRDEPQIRRNSALQTRRGRTTSQVRHCAACQSAFFERGWPIMATSLLRLSAKSIWITWWASSPVLAAISRRDDGPSLSAA